MYSQPVSQVVMVMVRLQSEGAYCFIHRKKTSLTVIARMRCIGPRISIRLSQRAYKIRRSASPYEVAKKQSTTSGELQ